MKMLSLSSVLIFYGIFLLLYPTLIDVFKTFIPYSTVVGSTKAYFQKGRLWANILTRTFLFISTIRPSKTVCQIQYKIYLPFFIVFDTRFKKNKKTAPLRTLSQFVVKRNEILASSYTKKMIASALCRSVTRSIILQIVFTTCLKNFEIKPI